ncbi:MAG TPA: RNA polymerase sigma factor [Mizugakiibacter sp.]
MEPTAARSVFAQEVPPDLLAQARRGDVQAHAELYRRFSAPVFNLALRVLGERAAAEDVVQEVFVRVLARVRRYRGEAPFGLWLRRLAVNATIDQLRARRFLAEIDMDTLLTGLGAPGPLPEEQAEALTLLMRLPPQARAVVVLHELEGYTHAELARMFDQTESYSKSILSRALARLRRRLGRGGIGLESLP